MQEKGIEYRDRELFSQGQQHRETKWSLLARLMLSLDLLRTKPHDVLFRGRSYSYSSKPRLVSYACFRLKPSRDVPYFAACNLTALQSVTVHAK